MKVLMLPTPYTAIQDMTNSINQIVLQLNKYLPEYDVQLVDERHSFDLVAGHAAARYSDIPVDVAITHGLYPTAYPDRVDKWNWYVNAGVIENMRMAREITAPSEWVADIYRRDMHVSPYVIPWAIEHHQWLPGTNQGYVLWNKTRDTGVCDPNPLLDLAAISPKRLFLTTFGKGTPNVKAVGLQPYGDMREMIRNAGVYLATTPETFGIAILEAMACGVPVLGYRWGALPDIITHGVDGYLVEPGNIEALREGLEYCYRYRHILGANAQETVKQYTWQRTAQAFARVFERALVPRWDEVKVSVVIPCYNYAQYVGEAIASVGAQATTFPYEIVVVNDGSTDDSETAITGALDLVSCAHSHIYKSNRGVAEARNSGIQHARGEYIVTLDADDKLGDPRFLQTLADALDEDRTLGVAFTGLGVMQADGSVQPTGFPNGYDYDRQVRGQNQVPTCAMFRKEAWTRAGGYRGEYTPAEDANFWLRLGAIGYRGRQVVSEPWFHYRLHEGSLSAAVREGRRQEPNWRDFPWVDGSNRPFASDGKPPFYSFPVRHYDKPQISVIIPVGPGHKRDLKRALDSVERQTFSNWEVIVVDDGAYLLDPVSDVLMDKPYVRFEETKRPGSGAGAARNIGVEAARAPLVLFLDADDLLMPDALEVMLHRYMMGGAQGYVYSDWISESRDDQGQLRRKVHQAQEYDARLLMGGGKYRSIHAVTVLLRAADHKRVGGFDAEMQSWEDLEYFLRLATNNVCGRRVAQPLLVYRYHSGNRREEGLKHQEALGALISERYDEYINGDKMCCGDPPRNAALPSGGAFMAQSVDENDVVLVEYNGEMASVTVRGPVTGEMYGYRQTGDRFFVKRVDANAQPERFVIVPEVELNATDENETPEPTLIAPTGQEGEGEAQATPEPVEERAEADVEAESTSESVEAEAQTEAAPEPVEEQAEAQAEPTSIEDEAAIVTERKGGKGKGGKNKAADEG